MANQFLGLSMFIMLLSFFIMLNSLSNFEDVKSKPVLSSVSLAFSSQKVESVEDETFFLNEEDDADGVKSGDALDEIEALFKSQISGYKLTHDRIGSSMHVRLSAKVLEGVVLAAKSASGAESSSGDFFLPTLVSLMESGRFGVMYRMDMVLNTPKSPVKTQSVSPKKALELIKKVSFFSEGLEAAGLPKKLISSGLAEGKSGYVDLYFRRYEPFNPYGKSSNAEGVL